MDSGRLEAVLPGTVHLDTVRALHQTVVSLRTALEVSKNELKELKEKYQHNSQSNDFQDVIEKLTLENHILRRRIIDSEYVEDDNTKVNPNIKFEVTYSPRSQRETDIHSDNEVVIKTATPDINSALLEVRESVSATSDEEDLQFGSIDKLNTSFVQEAEEEIEIPKHFSPSDNGSVNDECSHISISKHESLPSRDGFKTKLELLSKFDVRIKVRTLKEGTITSSTTSETDSEEKQSTDKERPKSTLFEEHREQNIKKNTENIRVESVSLENIKMAVPNEGESKSKNDKFDVQVRITSEENLVVKESFDSRKKDPLNLEVDDLSYRSLSEGENSVFSEGHTPNDPDPVPKQQDRPEDGSGNESEEVDDIELIFTTDESKDMSNLQEDLVSIRESEPWSPQHVSTTQSTPVLIKFHTLDPDFQLGETTDNAGNENQENSGRSESCLRMKRVSLPNDKEFRDIRKEVASGKSLDLPGRGILKSCDNKSDNMLYRRSPNTSSRRLDSADSLSCEFNRNHSLDTTKSSSFEMGSSMDFLQRTDSVDCFYRPDHFGKRYSVYAPTDLSKCGISEDDLAANLNVRRNTCPNPFQFRPSQRGLTRPIGPFKAIPTSSHSRPILRTNNAVRRESATQTDVCALPAWSSDSYLAHKIGWSVSPAPPRLGQRAPPPAPPRARRPAPPSPPSLTHTRTHTRALRDTHTNTDTGGRRLLLSDIGFTSMVPELTRSADPLWIQEQCTCRELSSVQPPSPSLSNTARFQARGSYRSPCCSIERSTDFIPQKSYASSSNRGSYRWRSSLPDVRGDDTDELLEEAESYLRRSIDNLRPASEYKVGVGKLGDPYIPSEPRQLRLGHFVKVITPQGRIAVGRVRYVGLAGGTAADSCVMIGAVVPLASSPSLPLNDGVYRQRRYFQAPPSHTALFVPFTKLLMAWQN